MLYTCRLRNPCSSARLDVRAPRVWDGVPLTSAPLAPAPYSKPFCPVEARYAFSVHRPTFTPQQQVNAPISPASALMGKLPDAGAERRLRPLSPPVAHPPSLDA